MALSPSIPTSFVPKQPVSTGKRKYSSGNNIPFIVGLAVFGVTLVVSGALFLYDSYLSSVQKSKAHTLQTDISQINPDTVTGFLRLRARLTSSKTILNNHILLSGFLNVLENVTLPSVTFSQLDVKVADDRSAKLTISGTAKNLNALANESQLFASQKYIKSAVFSKINVNANGTVGFDINALLDPQLILGKDAPPATPFVSDGTTPTAAAAAASAAAPTPAAPSVAQPTPATIAPTPTQPTTPTPAATTQTAPAATPPGAGVPNGAAIQPTSPTRPPSGTP